ncbi:undecaprenyldiphospho-muramoylpentapeptide beta-N-acetylglucosaminyltransferase [Candidatus Omnitrophota bacterium]
MRIVIAAGGTGGHLFPAIALAQELKKRGHSDIVFVCDENKRSKEIIKHKGFSFTSVDIPRMPYGFTAKWIQFIPQLLSANYRTKAVLSGLNPYIVVGFGAFISGVLVSVASRMGIKTMIHEQNVSLGRANRLLLKKADRVCFSLSNKYLNGNSKYILTGNPAREEILDGLKMITKDQAINRLKLSENKKTILVLGGSRGATSINSIMVTLVNKLTTEEKKRLQIIHITGPEDIEAVSRAYKESEITSWVSDFDDRMSLLYKAADLVVGRCGATTLSELSLFGIPAIFIPYPWAGNHQSENALFAAESGGAVLLEGKGLTANTLKDEIFQLVNNEEALRDMSSAMRSIANANACIKMADTVEGLANAE